MPKEKSQGQGPATGDRLPALTVWTAAGSRLDLHLARHACLVLVFPHPSCGECLRYLRRLADAGSRFDAWGGRVLAVPDEAAVTELTRDLAVPVAIDRDARVRAGADVPSDAAVIVVADRFGTVYRCDWPGRGHHFPPVQAIVDEVSYIGMQCPECGVPDDPLQGEEAWSR